MVTLIITTLEFTWLSNHSFVWFLTIRVEALKESIYQYLYDFIILCKSYGRVCCYSNCGRKFMAPSEETRIAWFWWESPWIRKYETGIGGPCSAKVRAVGWNDWAYCYLLFGAGLVLPLFRSCRYLQKDKVVSPEGSTMFYELAERSLDASVIGKIKEYVSQVLVDWSFLLICFWLKIFFSFFSKWRIQGNFTYSIL